MAVERCGSRPVAANPGQDPGARSLESMGIDYTRHMLSKKRGSPNPLDYSWWESGPTPKRESPD